MLRTLLNILPKNKIDDECNDGAGLLMTRYYLTPKIFGCRLVLHQFHRSDNDRHYHDHPWNFISLILKGTYWEHIPLSQLPGSFKYEDDIDIYTRHRPGSIVHRKKEWRHWVQLEEIFPNVRLSDQYGRVHIFKECWTLVLLYGKRRDWGFHTEEGWVKHDDYDCRGEYK